MKISVVIKDISKDSYSRACLNELHKEGVEIGDIIEGEYNPNINKTAVDFKSSKTGVDCMAWLGITCEETIVLTKEAKKRYVEKGLDKIIPLKIIERIEELCDCGDITKALMEKVVNNATFSKRKSYKGVGCRRFGAYRLATKNKRAFKNFVLAKSCGRTNGLFLYSKKTGIIWLSLFESYCFLSEYKNAYFNSLHCDIEGGCNVEAFNKPIGYYNSYDYLH